MNAPGNRKGPLPLARLTAKLLDPVTAKRGFAKGDLIGAWAGIVGPRFADSTMPEKLHWPRGRTDKATLTVRVAGPVAVFLQHETEQFISRINIFFGYEAVAQLRIVQRPLPPRRRPPEPSPPLPAEEAMAIDRAVANVESEALRSALARLGEAIARDRLATP